MSSPERPRLPFYQIVDGFRIPGAFSVENFRSALAYEPRPDDLFIATYPKCGTTWVGNIIFCILREGKPIESGLQFMTQNPFLELGGADAVANMERPGLIKVHLPFHLTPWSPEAKYIFVARNPKDACVSFYHHTERTALYRFVGGTFDDYFELFLEGQVDWGDYFDTTLSWYEHRHDPNVLFLTYEEIKKDTRHNVLRIAEFIDPKYKETLEKDEEYLQKVIYHSSFGFMKDHVNKCFQELKHMPKEEIESRTDISEGIKKFLMEYSNMPVSEKEDPEKNFFRKGVVGDWKNYFSQDQNERIMKKFTERLAGTELYENWIKEM